MRLEKTRYAITYESAIIELDLYHGALAGLVTAEVEFQDADQCQRFVAPDWFGREVTKDKRYKNRSLVVKGLPA